MAVNPQTALPTTITDANPTVPGSGTDLNAASVMPNFTALRDGLNAHTHSELATAVDLTAEAVEREARDSDNFTNLVQVIGSVALTVPQKQPNIAVAAGTINAQSTKDITITISGVMFGGQDGLTFSGVMAQPHQAIATGVVWQTFASAADTIILRFSNPTASGVSVGTINWDFWLVE